jgi:(1->4)-alpha-D-glucan 1-alpha-D-glucosylmutase
LRPTGKSPAGRICLSLDFPLGETLWGDTRLEIPQGLRSIWIDVFSEQEIPESDTINVSQALRYFPVSLLIGKNNG